MVWAGRRATWLAGALAGAVVASVIGARVGSASLVSAAALAVVGVCLVAGWRINRVLLVAQPGADSQAVVGVAARNSTLIAGFYAWGVATILASYYLTPLFWHHAWQYGGAMVMIGGLVQLLGRTLAHKTGSLSAPRWLRGVTLLALVHGAAALAGAVYVVVSGKLTTGKVDWVADIVFVIGGVGLAALSLLVGTAQWRGLRGRPNRTNAGLATERD